MARPMKNGLNYFSFDVDFFSDKKIKRLRARHGTNGIMVYMYLLCEIYRNGYYIDYNEDLILDVSDELNISEIETTQIMNCLLSRSLFDDRLAKSVKVLTAASVQRRYQEAKRGAKRDIYVDARLWVLKKEETEGFIKVHPDEGFSEDNVSFSEKKEDKSENNERKEKKGKEKKGKESIEADKPPRSPKPQKHKYGEYQRVLLTDDQLSRLINDYGERTVSEYIRKMDEWIQTKGESPYSDYNLAIRRWLERDGVKKHEYAGTAAGQGFI